MVAEVVTMMMGAIDSIELKSCEGIKETIVLLAFSIGKRGW